MTDRFPVRIARWLALVAAIGLAAAPAEAAGRKAGYHGRHSAKAAQASPAKVRAVEPEAAEATRATPSAAWTSGEQDRACFRGRRKLWQAGEGWVVKKVSVCP